MHDRRPPRNLHGRMLTPFFRIDQSRGAVQSPQSTSNTYAELLGTMMAEKDTRAAAGGQKRAYEQDSSFEPPHICKGTTGKCRKKPTKKDGLYIHPAGSDTKPIKVACVPCLAGHRSGECAHYDRILLKIRSAGRPSQACHHSTPCNGLCLQSQAYVVQDGEYALAENNVTIAYRMKTLQTGVASTSHAS